ncbi:transcriptional regulator [Pseudomonas sp. LPH1]|nr:helix-turn-helix transcriptional regulator [Pseudomonas sp. LPH1]AQZ33438.1 transcriptional regulator [Pseudomonas sp. LPH1]
MVGTDQEALAKAVGNAIAKQRMRCDMTQEQVAELVGIGSEAVSRIERGLVMPNIARLFDFASVFGCRAADLLSEVSPLPDDQAVRISQWLSLLDTSDRELIVETVERLSERLSRR